MAEKDLDKIQGFTKRELEELVEKCVDFVEIFCATEFYPYQKEFARSIVSDVLNSGGNILTGLFSRQSGKSETIANTAAALMVLLPKLANMKGDTYVFPQLQKFRKGFFVGIFTPSDNQSMTTYNRLKGKIDSPNTSIFFADPEFAPEGHEGLEWTNNRQDYSALNNGSLVQQMSASKQSKIESKSFHLILLDESQDLDEFIVNKSIRPMLAAYNGSTCATGTPGTTKGFFYNTIAFNNNEQTKPGEVQLHFQYDYKVCQRYNADYKKFVDKERRRLGEDSDEFRMAYKIEWLLERGMAISEELFDRLTRKDLNIRTSEQHIELVGGLDWGKSSDSTVLTLGRPIYDQRDESGRFPVEVIYWWEKMGDDYESIFAELKNELSKFSVQTLAVDSTGSGEPLADRLIYELPRVLVIPVKFSSQSKDHLYKNFLLMLQEEKVWWPGLDRLQRRKYWQMFKHQMLNLRKEYKGQFLSCHAPEDVRNAHDDFPDSLALMLWCIHEEAMPNVQISSAPREMYSTNDWKNLRPSNTPFTLR